MQMKSTCCSFFAHIYVSMNGLLQLSTFLKIPSLLPCQFFCQFFSLFLPLFWYERPSDLLHIGQRYPSPIHCIFDPHIHPVNVFFLRFIIHHHFAINVDKHTLLLCLKADVDFFSVLGLPKVYGDYFFTVRRWDALVTIKFVFIRGREIVDKTVYFIFGISRESSIGVATVCGFYLAWKRYVVIEYSRT